MSECGYLNVIRRATGTRYYCTFRSLDVRDTTRCTPLGCKDHPANIIAKERNEEVPDNRVGIKWNEPANLTVEGAPEDLALRPWAAKMLDDKLIPAAAMAKDIGISVGALDSATRNLRTNRGDGRTTVSAPRAHPNAPPIKPFEHEEPTADSTPLRAVAPRIGDDFETIITAFIRYRGLEAEANAFCEGWKAHAATPA